MSGVLSKALAKEKVEPVRWKVVWLSYWLGGIQPLAKETGLSRVALYAIMDDHTSRVNRHTKMVVDQVYQIHEEKKQVLSNYVKSVATGLRETFKYSRFHIKSEYTLRLSSSERKLDDKLYYQSYFDDKGQQVSLDMLIKKMVAINFFEVFPDTKKAWLLGQWTLVALGLATITQTMAYKKEMIEIMERVGWQPSSITGDVGWGEPDRQVLALNAYQLVTRGKV